METWVLARYGAVVRSGRGAAFSALAVAAVSACACVMPIPKSTPPAPPETGSETQATRPSESGGDVRSPTRGNDRPASELLTAEARAQAATFVARHYVSCADSSYVSLYFPANPNYGGHLGEDLYQCYQLRGLRWDVEGGPLTFASEAERLNEEAHPSGVEWKGEADIYYRVYRVYNSRDTIDSFSGSTGWNPWREAGQSPMIRLAIEKRRGSWSVSQMRGGLHGFDGYRPVPCNEIPDG